MKGRLIDMSMGLNRKQRITLEIDADFRSQFNAMQGKDLDISIKAHKPRRSLNANAYFHVLVNKIAAATGQSDEETKARLVCSYGTYAVDKDGVNVGFKLPESVDVSLIYPYTRMFRTDIENGKRFNCYLVYKETHTMNSSEMARLIDGTISEARDLGIETDTPEQLARLKSLWDSKP